MNIKNIIISEGIPNRDFLIEFVKLRFILNKSNSAIFKNSLNESIKNTNRVPYIETVTGIPIITIIHIVKIIVSMVCTPKYMGSSLKKKIIMLIIILKIIDFFKLKFFLAIMCIPQITKNISGIPLKKSSIQLIPSIVKSPCAIYVQLIRQIYTFYQYISLTNYNILHWKQKSFFQRQIPIIFFWDFVIYIIEKADAQSSCTSAFSIFSFVILPLLQ
jgi:hypothetical protein